VGDYSAPLTPQLYNIWGRFAAGIGAGLGKRRERGVGRGGKVEGTESEGPQVTVEPGPLTDLLRH